MTGTEVEHPNARLLRELFAAFDGGDTERIILSGALTRSR